MCDKARALQMFQEARAEADAFMRAFDQSGNIGHDKRAAMTRRGIGVGGNNAEMRFKCREGIRRNFRTSRRDARNQRGFSSVGETDQAYVRQQFQFKTQRAFFTGYAVFVFARGLMPGANEVRIAIAAATVPTLGREITLARLSQIEQLLAGI